MDVLNHDIISLPSGIVSGVDVSDASIFALVGLPFLGSLLVFLIGTFFSKSSDKHDDHKHDDHHDDHADHAESSKLPGFIATFFSVAAFGIALSLFSKLTGETSALTNIAWNWIEVGNLKIPFGFRFDNLSGMMCLVITGIGSLIHLYAVGYMAHDPHPARFFAYLNLFLGSMLILVLGDSLPMMFIGWEGVGLCSYLLIGFWYKEMPNAIAGQKAFVVNRIGDAGFLLGMFILFLFGQDLNIQAIINGVGGIPPYALEFAAILLLIGAAGKSAQVPLYVWLPDAMAGPTPVSALIHAATMVTSGVYMVTRLSNVFAHAPHALMIVSIVGALTALIAATIAIVQYDIKKVLAYSTVSQLGYMFMALGAGAFSVGMFHVVTHAFFKALLFMAAGSVIVGCHHEQDMRKFGGLFKYMKFTALTYLAGTYAIAGLPYGSGFFSKDAVLWSVYSNPSPLMQHEFLYGYTLSQCLWFSGLVTAALTAFYMTRSLMMTFTGSYRGEGHPHETSWHMVFPLVVLAVPSLGFGFLYGDSLLSWLNVWTRSDFQHGHHGFAGNHLYHTLELTSMSVAIVSALVAGIIYGLKPQIATSLAKVFGLFHKVLSNKWYVDEIYDFIIVKPLRLIATLVFKIIDRAIIDGLFVTGVSVLVDSFGFSLRGLHSGRIRSGASLMFSLFVFFLLFWMVI